MGKNSLIKIKLYRFITWDINYAKMSSRKELKYLISKGSQFHEEVIEN